MKRTYELELDKQSSKKYLMSAIGWIAVLIAAAIYLFADKSLLTNLWVTIPTVGIIFVLGVYNLAEIRHFIAYKNKPIQLKEDNILFINKWNYEEVDINKIRTIKIYKKKAMPNLLELKDENNKVIANIYLKGFSYTDINKFLVFLKENNTKIACS